MLRWLDAHALVLPLYLALVTALARIVYGLVARLVAPYPRVRAAVEALAAASPDVLRGLAQLYRAVTGRDLPMPLIDARDAELAQLRATVARQAALLASVSDGARERHPPPPRPSLTLLPVLITLLLVMTMSCAGGPRSADDTIATTLKVIHVARGLACNDGVDAVLGRPGPLSLDAPNSAIEGVQRVRSYVCADELTSLLQTTDELMTPRPAPSSAPSSPTTSSSAEDAGPPPTAATDAGEPEAVSGTP